MRHFLVLAAMLSLAACGTTPTPAPVTPTKPVADTRPQGGDLIGLTAGELGARFGPPRIQIREGDGTKLQFATKTCILDAYLYPPVGGKGVVRVAHVDARTPDGRDTDRARCMAAIEQR